MGGGPETEYLVPGRQEGTFYSERMWRDRIGAARDEEGWQRVAGLGGSLTRLERWASAESHGRVLLAP